MIKEIKNSNEYIKESSLSRIIRHIKSGNAFAVISAYRGWDIPSGWIYENPSITEEESLIMDKEAHEKLKKDPIARKYGFFEQKSGNKGNEEESLFIPNITYKSAFDLANKYFQQSMLYKDNDYFGVVYTIDFIDEYGVPHKEHDRGVSFELKRERGVITFEPEVLKYAYSQLKKGSKRFAYNNEISEDIKIFEKRNPGRTEVMIYRKLDFGYRWII